MSRRNAAASCKPPYLNFLKSGHHVKSKLSDSTEAAGDIANEFNDVLAAIVGFAELAAANRHVREDAKLALYIDEIRKSGLRGSELLLRWVTHAYPDKSAAARRKPQT